MIDEVRTPVHPAAPRDLTGATLGNRYELKDIVGGGGMGTVYRAIDLQGAREVAVKVLDPRFDPARDPAYRERFQREARLSTRLSHGNIVEVFDTGERDGVSYIVMELLHGRTLAQLIDAEGKLPPERALRIVRQMCAGLAFAHELGLMHRDLKPANVMVMGDEGEEWVKLLDFGLAKPLLKTPSDDDEVTRTSVVMGSPTYMAPEQARGEASVRSDIYSIGIMLFRMLSGQVPFTGRTAIDIIVQHIQTPLPWIKEIDPATTVSVELELVVRRCLEKDPRARFGSVQALVSALDEAEKTGAEPFARVPTQRMAAVQTQPSAPAPLPATLFAAETSRSAKWPYLAAAGLLLGGVVAVVASSGAKKDVAPPPAAVSAAKEAEKPAQPAAAQAPVPGGPVLFRINSIPAGATVKVGSRTLGVTPVAFELPPDASGEATAELTLELAGYQELTFIATSPGPRFDLVQRLQKGRGRVQLSRVVARNATAASEAKADPVVVADPVPAAPEPAPVAEALKPEPSPVEALPMNDAPPPAPARTTGPVPADQLTVRPRLVEAGEPPRYSREAALTKVEGDVVAKCVVTTAGALEQCRVVKSVPMMDEAVLESLKTRRYEPGRVGADAVETELSVIVKLRAR